ncbi:hypothetical protein ABZ690_02930 [Streptomyces sp. NPDC006967]|uniref:hypothetical protein n=1 Tax=unclassified Streptomyces TaxID=2593676 RepID=UPI000CD55E4A|nr:hypothetical protein [Streptomyces sp. SM1]
MKSRSKRLAISALTAAALTAALPAAPAFATDEIDCGTGDSAVRMTYVENGAEHARRWENPGGVPVDQYGVTSFSSGANEVVVFWSAGMGWKVNVLEPYTTAPFTGADTYLVYGFQVL